MKFVDDDDDDDDDTLTHTNIHIYTYTQIIYTHTVRTQTSTVYCLHRHQIEQYCSVLKYHKSFCTSLSVSVIHGAAYKTPDLLTYLITFFLHP